jgi:hypothetical protein
MDMHIVCDAMAYCLREHLFDFIFFKHSTVENNLLFSTQTHGRNISYLQKIAIECIKTAITHASKRP